MKTGKALQETHSIDPADWRSIKREFDRTLDGVKIEWQEKQDKKEPFKAILGDEIFLSTCRNRYSPVFARGASVEEAVTNLFNVVTNLPANMSLCRDMGQGSDRVLIYRDGMFQTHGGGHRMI